MPRTTTRSVRWWKLWIGLALAHLLVASAMRLANKFELAGVLRDPFGVVSVVSMYGPIALATRLGFERSTFERAAWLFGELTPAGWVLVIASWLLVHALLAGLWVAWRRRG